MGNDDHSVPRDSWEARIKALLARGAEREAKRLAYEVWGVEGMFHNLPRLIKELKAERRREEIRETAREMIQEAVAPKRERPRRGGYTTDERAVALLRDLLGRRRIDCLRWTKKHWEDEVGCGKKMLSPGRAPKFDALLQAERAKHGIDRSAGSAGDEVAVR